MAHKPIKAKTQFMQLPIPDISQIPKPPCYTSGIPVEGVPQGTRQYNRSQG